MLDTKSRRVIDMAKFTRTTKLSHDAKPEPEASDPVRPSSSPTDLFLWMILWSACSEIVVRFDSNWRFLRHLFRRLQIRCFFGFCEFAVSCYGSKYILKAAFIAAHLFERLELFRCFHKWCWFNDEHAWWPNDQAEPRRDRREP
jgi:hypothetical protein